MDSTFDVPLRRDRLHQQVADRIQDLIVNESLRPGDRLPSERDLAERLGVSRTVIREAIRVLGAQGLVDVRPGSGSYVQEPSADDAAASIERLLRLRQAPGRYEALGEVRRTLEIEIAGLAARRATEMDVASLEGALAEMAAHAGDAEQFTRQDLAFHAALVGATHNELYGVLLIPITDLLLDFRLAAYRYDARSAIEDGLAFHREILDHVRARDSEGARRAMRQHLGQAERLIAAAQGDAVRQSSPGKAEVDRAA